MIFRSPVLNEKDLDQISKQDELKKIKAFISHFKFSEIEGINNSILQQSSIS